MSDKTLLLAEAMGYIDEKFIEEAHSEARGIPYQIAHRRRTFRQIAAVACLCLVAIGVARLPEMVNDMNASGEAAPMDPGVDNPFGNQDGGIPENNTPTEDTISPPENETETEAET